MRLRWLAERMFGAGRAAPSMLRASDEAVTGGAVGMTSPPRSRGRRRSWLRPRRALERRGDGCREGGVGESADGIVARMAHAGDGSRRATRPSHAWLHDEDANDEHGAFGQERCDLGLRAKPDSRHALARGRDAAEKMLSQPRCCVCPRRLAHRSRWRALEGSPSRSST
jgi:hypothetical protein